MIGLGKALHARGHRVTLLANEHFALPIAQAGLEFLPVGSQDEFRQAFDDPDIWHWSQGWPVVCQKLIRPSVWPVYRAIEAAYVPGETVVGCNHLAPGALLAREKLGTPTAILFPSTTMLRNEEAPAVLHALFVRSRFRWLTRLQYWLADVLAVDPALRPVIDPVRRELGLPIVRRLLHRWAVTADRMIGFFPEWYAPRASHWPAQATLTGFHRVDLAEQCELAPGLVRFLESGAPPVAFTLGSAMHFAREFFSESVEVCRRLGCRGLLLTKHDADVPAALPPEIHHARYVPFGQVFPRLQGIVHHGGIGTLAMALESAIPQLAIPMAHDQFDQAARLRSLGVGDWLWRGQYRAASVAAKLQGLLKSPQVAARCRELSARIQGAPDPFETCCEQMEGLIGRSKLSRAG